MRGLFGCWQRDGRALDAVRLTQCLTSGDIACVFDGRIDNRDTLIRSLGRHPLATPQAEDRELIVAAYDRFGESFVERLEGDFAIGVFDRRANRLLLARDRLGLRPLCYTQFNGTLLFASEAKPLLACP